MSVQTGVPSTESAVLLKQGLEQMEADIKAGTVASDMLFTSLAEVDAYYFSSKQPDGAQITGILFRTRVPPYMCFATSPIVPLQAESIRIINSRLPAPPPPTKSPAVSKAAVVDPRQSLAASRAKRAGDAARRAAAARAAQDPGTPPGSLPASDVGIPPALDDDSGVPQG